MENISEETIRKMIEIIKTIAEQANDNPKLECPIWDCRCQCLQRSLSRIEQRSMNYKAYFTLEKRLRKAGFNDHRSDLILSFTEGRTESLRELSPLEYQQFISWIKTSFDLQEEDWQQSPENRMRRKIYALFIYHMGYTKEGLENWCIKYGKYHKGLNDHNYNELVDLVTQAENAYSSFTKAIAR